MLVMLKNPLCTVHSWCSDHSTSVNACGVQRASARIQVSRKEFHTHIHLDQDRLRQSRNSILYQKKKERKISNFIPALEQLALIVVQPKFKIPVLGLNSCTNVRLYSYKPTHVQKLKGFRVSLVQFFKTGFFEKVGFYKSAVLKLLFEKTECLVKAVKFFF